MSSALQQTVYWALEHSCGLRKETAANEPKQAFYATCMARSLSGYLREPKSRIYGDICITTTSSMCKKNRGTKYGFPSEGFRISEKFGALGGVDGLFAMCGSCPANPSVAQLAACTGTFSQEPNSDTVESQLQGILDRMNLREKHAKLFPRTARLWYGLWAQSPLAPEALRVLKIIMSEVVAEDKEENKLHPLSTGYRHLPYMQNFLRAVEQAEKHGLAMHVRLSAPGTSSIVGYFIHPHCPFCKAQADPMPRLGKEGYPADLITCHICGTRYSPVETDAMGPILYDGPARLSELLGPGEFDRLVCDYYISNGYTLEQARVILENEKADRIESRRRFEEDEKRMKLQYRYVGAVLHRGLTVHQESEEDLRMHDAKDFVEILNRCEELGITISAIYRASRDFEIEGATFDPEFPLSKFSEWQREGHDGFFFATYTIPDELLASFAAANPQE